MRLRAGKSHYVFSTTGNDNPIRILIVVQDNANYDRLRDASGSFELYDPLHFAAANNVCTRIDAC